MPARSRAAVKLPDADAAGTTEPPARAERAASGRDARRLVPRESHAEFSPAASRDPVGLLIEQARSRIPELVPVRYGRMLVSPFAYYRGVALPMAADLATTPTSGLRVQLCGDAHLSNFGAFASPERRLVFDVNDFDETLPGPFEWDVKRLAASLAIVGRENGFGAKACRQIVRTGAESYRTAMRGFAGQHFIDVWYAHLEVAAIVDEFRSRMQATMVKATEKLADRARTRDSMQELDKLTTVTGGQRRIVSDPPLLEPIEEVYPDVPADVLNERMRALVAKYRSTLQSDRRNLLEYFTLVQAARKVVGVGSVGTRAWMLLMAGADPAEPLLLQVKEAQPSVLAAYCGPSQFGDQGERVVAGQHLMQAESDIFLGWTRAAGPDGVHRDYYVRQLKDWKFAMPVEQMVPSALQVYARLCGWTLAHSHARSGDRIALAAYLGGSATFDLAIADFAQAYADQNERDYAALKAAVRDGRVEARTGI
jgi:uncharacterized protein (DUF2252 family)